jgi:thiol:disulfide interchange protein DsbC
MLDGKTPATAQCDTPIAKNSEMANRYRIRGTPTMFLADGQRLGGYVPLAELDRMMNEVQARAAKR